MIAYLDASVLLRVVLAQRGRLREWRRVEVGVASGIARVECLRTVDRLRLAAGLSDDQVAERREAVYRLTDEMEIVEPGFPVLERAALPLPTPLGTRDAIHLATALLWREERGVDLVMATHDRALGMAARASGLRVVGL